MKKEEALEVIRTTFVHLFCEENVEIGNTTALLYFPSMGIAIIEVDENKRQILNDDNVEDMDAMLIKREAGAEPVYLDLEEENFNIGLVIHDILMAARFEPAENFFLTKETY
jgi:hypothetical protein